LCGVAQGTVLPLYIRISILCFFAQICLGCIRVCGRADTTLSTIIIGDGRAAEQIPHDAQGRFIMEDGTVFQAYYFNDATLK